MTPEDRRRRRQGSRRAQSGRDRRAAAQQSGKSGALAWIIIILVVAAAAGAATWFLVLRDDGGELGYATPLLPPTHAPPYVWNVEVDGIPGRIPPTSGHHFDLPHLGWGFLGGPLLPERALHNLEHGGIVIWHQPDDPALAGAVNAFVRDKGNQCLLAGSFADMTYEVAVTAWGRVLPLDAWDEEQVRAFVEKYQGSQGPEAGLCWYEPAESAQSMGALRGS